ncbi:MAG: hypothetical protein K6F84_05270, partial [Lachnospiraceae bacterium]|nr:hypothetical protein [Lachnospiraceae bacterium]
MSANNKKTYKFRIVLGFALMFFVFLGTKRVSFADNKLLKTPLGEMTAEEYAKQMIDLSYGDRDAFIKATGQYKYSLFPFAWKEESATSENIENAYKSMAEKYNDAAGISTGKSFAIDDSGGYNKGDYKSIDWEVIDKRLYGNASNKNHANTYTGASNVGYVEKKVSKMFADLAWFLYSGISSWNIDLSISGLVFGRIRDNFADSSVNADFTHFGLENNNPYGIVAASVFYVLRRTILACMPIIILILLIRQLFFNGAKEREQLKRTVSNMAILIVLLFSMPYLVKFFCYIRDGLVYTVNSGVNNILNAAGITSNPIGDDLMVNYRKMYVETPSLLNAVLCLAVTGSSLFYLADYICIAILLALCFGVFPLVALFSIWNRRILSDWFSIILPNCLTQAVDVIVLQLPCFLALIYNKIYNPYGTKSGAFGLGIVLIIAVWSALALRKRVIKLFGFEGFNSRGAGLMALAGMATRLMRPKSDPHRGGREDHAWNESGSGRDASEYSERQNIMNDALKDLGTDDSSASDEMREFSKNSGSDVTKDIDSFLDEQNNDSDNDFFYAPNESGELNDSFDDGITGSDISDNDKVMAGNEDINEMENNDSSIDDTYVGVNPEGENTGNKEDTGVLNEESFDIPEEPLDYIDGYNEGGSGSGTVDSLNNAYDSKSEERMEAKNNPINDELSDIVSNENESEEQSDTSKDQYEALTNANPGNKHTSYDVSVSNMDNVSTDEAITGESSKVSFASDSSFVSEASTDSVKGTDAKDYTSFIPENMKDNHKYVPSTDVPHMDNDGRGEKFLSDDRFKYDHDRYRNLQKMDDYSAQISRNNSQIERSGYNNSTYDNDVNKLNNRIGQLEQTKGSIREKMDSVDDRTSKEYLDLKSSYDKADNLQNQAYKQREELHKADDAYRDNINLQKGYDKAVNREVQYAKAMEVGGMDSRCYTSAKDFGYAKNVDAIKRSRADYKNFDSKQYEKILT